jgi:hypothetical protein
VIAVLEAPDAAHGPPALAVSRVGAAHDDDAVFLLLPVRGELPLHLRGHLLLQEFQ